VPFQIAWRRAKTDKLIWRAAINRSDAIEARMPEAREIAYAISGVSGVSSGIILKGIYFDLRSPIAPRFDQRIEAFFVYTPTANGLERQHAIVFTPAAHRFLRHFGDPRGRERVQRFVQGKDEVEFELDGDGRAIHMGKVRAFSVLLGHRYQQRDRETEEKPEDHIEKIPGYYVNPKLFVVTHRVPVLLTV
jgi:hypothetical protein